MSVSVSVPLSVTICDYVENSQNSVPKYIYYMKSLYRDKSQTFENLACHLVVSKET